jgi:pyrimidine-nucleoside phosphorylase
VDKHSTGGVGDKTTLVVLPILAACGLSVVKMSGRGLGITGGTIDKLSAIPGVRTDLSSAELIDQAARIGIAIGGQTHELAPADGVLYALRDVTGTTASLPLIVSSILSKKIASGAEILVLDVKWGRGAFMTTRSAAIELGQWLIRIGRRSGLKVSAVLSAMNEPLGAAVGNSLEVAEALQVLAGDATGPKRQTYDLAVAVASLALQQSGVVSSPTRAESMVVKTIESGRAAAKAEEWIRAQGGQMNLPVAPVQHSVRATQSGWIVEYDAAAVADVVLDLGGGRRQKADTINPTVGLVRRVSVGDAVQSGDILGDIHASSPADIAKAEAAILQAVKISPEPSERPILWEFLDEV